MKKIIGAAIAAAAFVLAGNVHALSVMGTATATLGAAVSATATTAATGSVSTGIGLQAEVQSGALATSTDSAVVNLQGNALGLIQTNDDLATYDTLVVGARPAVKNINVNDDGSMEIAYVQPAKFLGIFPASITGDVNIDANGTVTVSTPWYGFLYTKDTTPVQASVAAAVQQSGVAADAQGSTDMQAQLQDRAMLVNAITAAIQVEASASATTAASAQ